MRALVASFCFFATALAQNLITTAVGTDQVIPAAGVNSLQVALAPYGTGAIDNAGNYYFVDFRTSKVLKLTPGGLLTVVAGDGLRLFSGDGGPANRAAVFYPYGLAFDTAGNLLIADTFNYRIRRMDRGTGLITTIAGYGVAGGTSGDGNPAVSATFGQITGIAVDAANNIYICDSTNAVVRRINASGIISTFAAAPLKAPYGIAVDTASNVYVADPYLNQVIKFSQSGSASIAAGRGTAGFSDGPATQALLNYPTGVAVDAAGDLFIADVENNRIRKVSGGTMSTIAGISNGFAGGFSGDGGAAISAGLSFPFGVSVDAAGDLFVLDYNDDRIREITGGVIKTVAGSSVGSLVGDGGPSSLAVLNAPVGVAADNAGNVFVADTGSHRIRKITPNGSISTYAGTGNPGYSGNGSSAPSAMLNNPYGVAVDSAGNVYVADTDNYVIRKITPSQIITTIAGTGQLGIGPASGAATSVPLDVPVAVAVDGSGNVYIAEEDSGLVRKLSNGQLSVIGRQFASAYGVAVDSIGNVYVADASAGAVYRIATSGSVSTIAQRPQLSSPVGVAVDNNGNVLVSDEGFSSVLSIAPNGGITRIAGNGQDGFSGDGGPATLAQISALSDGVAAGPGNNIFIADTGNNRIREILASPPVVSASPGSLTFSANAGDASTAFQTVTLSSIAGVGYAVQTSAPWIQVSPSAGAAPGSLQVTVDPASLAAGQQQGTITISAPGAAPSSLTVSVSAAISQGQPATLSVNATGMRFGLIQGTGSSQQQLLVQNSGGGSLTYTAAVTFDTGSNWLTLSPSNGTATSVQPGTIAVTASPQALNPGTYSATIVISSAAGNKSVPVIMTVAPAQPKILLSENGVTFQVLPGGAALPASFSILNTGQGELFWTAAPSTLSGGNWLTIDTSTGTVVTPFTGISQVNVSVNASGLQVGQYYGQIAVSAPGAGNSPQILSVLLSVLGAGSTLNPQVGPSSLIFFGAPSSNPSAQQILIANPTAQSLTFTTATALADSNTIIASVPQSGSLAPGGTAAITVQPDFSKQAAGANVSTLGIQFSNGNTGSAEIITVSGTGAGSNSDSPLSAASSSTSCTTLNLYANSPATINISQGQAALIAVLATSCGTPVTDPNTQVVATFSNHDPPQKLTSAGNGIWQTSYTPIANAPSGTIATSVQGLLGVGTTLVASPKVAFNVVLQSAPVGQAQPIVPDGGVANGASFEPGLSKVAPGSYVSIFGLNLGDPSHPANTIVTLGSTTLALTYVAGGQVNAQIPFNEPLNLDQSFVVQVGTQAAVTTPVSVAPADPAIFTLDQSGSGQGAIVNAITGAIANAQTPVGGGDIVAIYCTGLGQVDQPLQAGQVSPSVPLAHTINAPTVTIGGQPATVQFSGLAPGYVGLYQINAFVPSGLASGPQNLQITVAGQVTPPDKVVTIVVH